MAKKYIKDFKPGIILISTPDLVFKNSYKIPDITNFDSLAESTQDSILFFSSEIIQFCDDSIYINTLVQAINNGLEGYGYTPLFNHPDEEFLNVESKSFKLNIAQIQLEEFYDSIYDETPIDFESSHEFKLFINAVNLNTWFDIATMGNQEPELFFNSIKLTDAFQGHIQFDPFTGEVFIKHSVDSLKIEDIYNAAHELGRLQAKWIFNHFMNESIKLNMPQGQLPEKLYSYDYIDKSLKRSSKSHLIKM